MGKYRRVAVSLSQRAADDLDLLATVGLFGSSRAGAAQVLIYQQLQDWSTQQWLKDLRRERASQRRKAVR